MASIYNFYFDYLEIKCFLSIWKMNFLTKDTKILYFPNVVGYSKVYTKILYFLNVVGYSRVSDNYNGDSKENRCN